MFGRGLGMFMLEAYELDTQAIDYPKNDMMH
jgi:hypothetical protein